MDNTGAITAAMKSEIEQIQKHQVLNNWLREKLELNQKEFKTWIDKKKQLEKVIEGLQEFPLSVSEKCMVPISKLAFMKGKLIHTNEILACLGDGYFAKYSASQAIALCNRKISYIDETLRRLENERMLYDTRLLLLAEHDIFGEQDKKDVSEHWDEDKLDEWRIQHRQREKEYRQKLSELKEKEKTNICTEEDLFKRLDELELEEELEDEMCRLEDERQKFYSIDLEEGEVYDESEEDDDTDSDSVTVEMIQEELKKLKDIQANRVTNNTSNISNSCDATQDETFNTNFPENIQSDHTVNSTQEASKDSCLTKSKNTSKITTIQDETFNTNSSENIQSDHTVSSTQEASKESCLTESENTSKTTTIQDEIFNTNSPENIQFDHTVNSAQEASKESCLTESESTSKTTTTQDEIFNTNSPENIQSDHTVNSTQETSKESCLTESESTSKSTDTRRKKKVSFVELSDQSNAGDEPSILEIPYSVEQDDTYNEENNDDIRIEFSHSTHLPTISESNNTEIQSPADIYKMFSVPIKPILKRSPNDMFSNQVVPPLHEDSSTDEDTEDESNSVKPSAYGFIMKDIQEKKATASFDNTVEKNTRPVSRFKMERVRSVK